MKILFDHCVPQRLRRYLPGHEISTAAQMGWDKLRNGELLTAAAKQFDVVLTVDRNIKHEQNLAQLPLAVLVLLASTNKLADLVPLAPAVQEALKELRLRTLVEVSAR